MGGVPPPVPGLQPFHDGWANHQRLLLDALRDLTPEQLGLRTAANTWAVWQVAAHIAGGRVYWLHDVLGEGDRRLRDLFRVASTTVPGLPLEAAGWEDDEDHPRGAAELAEALTESWSLIDDCLRRWTSDDLVADIVKFSRHHTRGWVLWHLLEHDIHHGGAISLILGNHGVAGIDI